MHFIQIQLQWNVGVSRCYIFLSISIYNYILFIFECEMCLDGQKQRFIYSCLISYYVFRRIYTSVCDFYNIITITNHNNHLKHDQKYIVLVYLLLLAHKFIIQQKHNSFVSLQLFYFRFVSILKRKTGNRDIFSYFHFISFHFIKSYF